MWKDKGLQLVMLPTNERVYVGGMFIKTKECPVRIDGDMKVGEMTLNENPRVTGTNEYFEAQHLYLLSDEDMRVGDINVPSDFSSEGDLSLTSAEDLDVVNDKFNGYRKVIACNNPSLNLPQFPNAFIEEYVNRYNSKKSLEVEVEYIIEHNLRTRNKEEEFKEVLVIKEGEISIRFKEERIV